MFKNRDPKKRRLFLIIPAAILILLALIFFAYKTYTENKLTRFDIDAQNLNCTTSSEIIDALKKMNLNYFYFKSSDVEYELRKKFFCIGKIESEVTYPDHLKLKISGREGKFVVNTINSGINTNPVIQLSLDQLNATQSTTEAFPPKVLNQILDNYKDSSESAMFLVDQEGAIFEEVSSNTAYPRLSIFEENLKIGQKIPDGLIPKALEILEALKKTDTPSDNLLVVGDKLIVDTKPRITFALNRPLDRQSASLQLILRQAKMNLDPDSKDSKSVDSIDLRFDRPVVVYGKK